MSGGETDTAPVGRELEGRVAVVTGASRNVGKAIALALADQGADVAVAAHSSPLELEGVAAEVRARGVRSVAVLADIGTSSEVRQLATRVRDELGPVGIVVNNAAIRPDTPFLDLQEDEWHRVLGVDLHGAYYTSKEFLPDMVAAGWGRIVNITGMNAMAGNVGRPHVAAAKHGLWGLTKALAKEFGPSGVTVNAISPGPIEIQFTPHWAGHQDPEAIASGIPARRLGTPDEIAGLCAYLASDAAGFISGQMVGVNGGAQS